MDEPMLSLDTVRAAALSDQPWTRLDELVRAEMATGRKVNQIADDFARMADAVWDTPGLSDDGHNAFGDTYDALTGSCHRDCCYYDPPTLPTEEEVSTLPRWARVAFAARVARYIVYPNVAVYGTPSMVEPVYSAIALAEDSAGDADVSTGLFSIAAQMLDNSLNGNLPHVKDIFSSITLIASSILDVLSSGDFSINVYHFEGISSLGDIAVRGIRRDFDHIARLAKWQHWTDDTPVPPDVFGPIWPEGPPPGWPDPDVPARTELTFDLLVRDGVADGITEDETVNLFHAVNAYYIARTGDRLTLDGYKALIAALTPAGV